MTDHAMPQGPSDSIGATPGAADWSPHMAEREPTMAEIDREIAEAMEGMPASDMAALGMAPDAGASVEPGTELVGTVVQISNDDIFVEFGTKSQGVLPRNQFGKKEPVEVGRKVDVTVDRYDATSGLFIVNRKGAITRATWTNLTKGQIVEGRVTGVIKGGLEIDLKGIRAFMPGSQVDVAQMKDISVLLNQMVKCEVVELDRRHKNVLVSRRKLQEKERAENRDKLLAELAPGQIRSGVVGNLTDFGAFVDLGGVDGLVHISDLSWGNVAKVSDVLRPGQKVEVRILKIDRERDRISLGIKQTLPDPWDTVASRFNVGSPVKVRVTRLADFGAFAELEAGIEGLIPLSEMGWSRVNRPSDAVSPEQLVDAVIIRVEPDKRRIALSLKQAQNDPWGDVLESFAPQSIVKGRVTRIADFGAFVEIATGVEGMVHISEMSDKRIKSCGEVVKVGQEVETRVLGVDKEQRRISLSIKAVHAPQVSAETSTVESAQTAAPAAPPKEPKKRKKPLRGGLASHLELPQGFGS